MYNNFIATLLDRDIHGLGHKPEPSEKYDPGPLEIANATPKFTILV